MPAQGVTNPDEPQPHRSLLHTRGMEGRGEGDVESRRDRRRRRRHRPRRRLALRAARAAPSPCVDPAIRGARGDVGHGTRRRHARPGHRAALRRPRAARAQPRVGCALPGVRRRARRRDRTRRRLPRRAARCRSRGTPPIWPTCAACTRSRRRSASRPSCSPAASCAQPRARRWRPACPAGCWRRGDHQVDNRARCTRRCSPRRPRPVWTYGRGRWPGSTRPMTG